MLLPENERANLAYELLVSLEPDSVEHDEIAAEWSQEIGNRLKRIKSGDIQTHDWRAAIQEIRNELKKDAAS